MADPLPPAYRVCACCGRSDPYGLYWTRAGLAFCNATCCPWPELRGCNAVAARMASAREQREAARAA